MKKITCEMCGSNDLIKKDGVFVCQYCGCQYTVEEAKKLMVEGIVNVTGTVKVDETDKTANFIELAKTAYNASRWNEADTYCTRILEIDRNNYEAWLIKGKIATHNNQVENIYSEVCINYFSKSIEYAPQEKTDEIKKIANNEFVFLFNSALSMLFEEFESDNSIENAQSIYNCSIKIDESILIINKKCGIKCELKIIPSKIMEEYFYILNSANRTERVFKVLFFVSIALILTSAILDLFMLLGLSLLLIFISSIMILHARKKYRSANKNLGKRLLLR